MGILRLNLDGYSGRLQEFRRLGPWRNICLAWSKLKPLLVTTAPCNQKEWNHLPLWRPHRNHRSPQLAKCATQANHLLRQAGLNTMQDVISPMGAFLAWQELPAAVIATGKQRAYQALIDTLQPIPNFATAPGQQSLFFAESVEAQIQHIWQFNIAQQELLPSGLRFTHGTPLPECLWLR